MILLLVNIFIKDKYILLFVKLLLKFPKNLIQILGVYAKNMTGYHFNILLRLR